MTLIIQNYYYILNKERVNNMLSCASEPLETGAVEIAQYQTVNYTLIWNIFYFCFKTRFFITKIHVLTTVIGADCEASPAPRGGGAIKVIKSTTPGCQRILKLVVKIHFMLSICRLSGRRSTDHLAAFTLLRKVRQRQCRVTQGAW